MRTGTSLQKATCTVSMRMGTSASILSFTYQEAYYHLVMPTLILCLMPRGDLGLMVPMRTIEQPQG